MLTPSIPAVEDGKIFMVLRGELEGRFDAGFYSFDFRVTKRELFTFLGINAKSILHPPEYPREFSEAGYQLIRSQNVRPHGLSLGEKPVYFSEDFLKEKKIIYPQKGDVLVVRSGVNAGDVAVVEENVQKTIVGADTLLVKCKENVVPKFLQVYFHTDIGKRQISRHTTGATNKHLNSENLAKVLIPKLSIEQQKFAISQYEKALSDMRFKEAKASRLLASIDAYLLEQLGITLFEQTEKKKVFFMCSDKVSGGRLDPQYYKPEYLQLINAINHTSNERLGRIIKFSSETWNQKDYFETHFPYIEISEINLSKGTISNVNQIELTEAPSRARMIVREGDIIVSTTRPSRGAIAKISVNEDFSIASTGFAVIRYIDETKIIKEYLHAILRHRLCLVQMEQRSSGGNYPAITQEELGNIKIPIPPLQIQTEIVTRINIIIEQTQKLETEAKAAVESAKKEVEAMILGEGSNI